MNEAVGREGVAPWIAELSGLAGDGQVLSDAQSLAAHTIDGLRPWAVVRPRTAAQVGEVLRWAFGRRLAVAPWGGGTKQGVGRPLARLDLVLKTDALNRVLELDEGNLTAEVEAGISLGDLQAQLAKRNLFLALDPLDGESATIGGIIATNASGPARLLYRTARDHVLGLQVALADGRHLRAGGKTMKDVAGYNLVKPLIGSLGTLGVIVGATVRLQPLPEAYTTVAARFRGVQPAAQMAMRVRGTTLAPTAMELVSETAWRAAGGGDFGGEGATLLIGVGGAREAVTRHDRDLTQLAEEAGALEVVAVGGDEMAAVWRRRQNVAAGLAAIASGLVRVKIGVPMSTLGAALAAAEAEGARRGLGVAYAGHAGNGIAQVFFVGAEASIIDAVLKLRELASGLGGYLILEVASPAAKRQIDPLPIRDDYALMRRIRESLNPADTLNPGKLF